MRIGFSSLGRLALRAASNNLELQRVCRDLELLIESFRCDLHLIPFQSPFEKVLEHRVQAKLVQDEGLVHFWKHPICNEVDSGISNTDQLSRIAVSNKSLPKISQMHAAVPSTIVSVLLAHAAFSTKEHLQYGQNKSPPLDAICEILAATIIAFVAIVFMPKYTKINTRNMLAKM